MRRFFAALVAVAMMATLFASCGGAPAVEKTADIGTAVADDSLKKVQDKGTFVLGFDENFPPMGYKEGGQYTGFDIQVATELFGRLGIGLKLQPIDWKANIMELESGNVDCLWNGVTITDERSKQILFSDAYLNNEQVVVVMDKSNIKSLAELKGKKLGIQSGSSANVALDAKTDFKSSLGEVVSFKDNMTALMDLETGGLDAVLLDSIVAGYNITMSKKPYRILSESLGSEKYGIGFRKNDVALRDAVNAELKKMADDGSLARISTKWFTKDITTIGK
ncbi:MAG: amino acid ABC transporter substrate-binding protein [Clostridia bacterium]